MELLLLAPITFALYLLLAAILNRVGRLLAVPAQPSRLKSSIYASGEVPDSGQVLVGYRKFFGIALFFAVLHLGVLMLGSSDLSPLAAVYLLGLVCALLALMLG